MNPHAKHETSITSIGVSLKKNKNMIIQLVKKEIKEKYKGSFLGAIWPFLTPILMLVVYTFVFSVVFKARWPAESSTINETKINFSLILFVGLLVHSLFGEVINASTTVITNNTNLVKKVVFPLEILIIIKTGVALFNFFIGLIVLYAGLIILGTPIHATALLIPIVIAPLVILTLGLGWFTSSFCVYIRDLGQPISIFVTIMLFLSPIFFPSSAVPESYRAIINANPLTPIIEQARNVLLFGKMPDFFLLLSYSIIATMLSWGGYAWFQKTRKGFADVL